MGGNIGGKLNAGFCPECGEKVRRFKKLWIHEADGSEICASLGKSINRKIGGGRG